MRLPEKLVALVDGERIQTVVENLILNALEAMIETPGKIIIAGEKQVSGEIVLTITDTGVGMSQSYIEQKLFHPFATTKKKGMGLGLYTCREVIKANGGSIEVSSKLGVGTTFRVVLPSPPSDNAEA
jgi:signal transduction histidine kinase